MDISRFTTWSLQLVRFISHIKSSKVAKISTMLKKAISWMQIDLQLCRTNQRGNQEPNFKWLLTWSASVGPSLDRSDGLLEYQLHYKLLASM